MSWLNFLKKRWGVRSYFDVIVILLVFACTGFTIMYLKRLIGSWVGIDQNTATWLKWLFSLIVILPLYQVVLLIYGWIFGRFEFFWNFEKKMFNRIFSKKSKLD